MFEEQIVQNNGKDRISLIRLKSGQGKPEVRVASKSQVDSVASPKFN